MEIKQLTPTPGEVGSLLPARMQGLISSEGIRIYAATAWDELLGLAVVSRRTGPEPGYILNYLETYENAPAHIARTLVRYVEDICRAENTRELAVQLIEEGQRLYDQHDLLLSMTYKCLSYEGHYLLYYLDDVLDTRFAEKINTMAALTDHVKRADNLSRPQLSAFSNRLKKSGRPLGLSAIDRRYTLFYVVGDEIKAYMDIRRSEGTLYTDDIYMEGSEKTRYAVPAMLATVIKNSMGHMRGETRLIFRLQGDGLYKGVRELLGTPEEDKSIFEYNKAL